MTAHLDTILTAEVSNLVCTLEIPHTLLRMNLTGLPVVLGSHTVELLDDEGFLGIVSYIALIQRHTDGEIPLIGIFQTNIFSGINLTKLCKYGRASGSSQN